MPSVTNWGLEIIARRISESMISPIKQESRRVGLGDAPQSFSCAAAAFTESECCRVTVLGPKRRPGREYDGCDNSDSECKRESEIR
jgi:hypothetical protein